MMTFLSTGILLFDFFIILGAAVLAIYVYFLNSYQYWKNRGVVYLEPKFPYGKCNNAVFFVFIKSVFREQSKFDSEISYICWRGQEMV